MGTAELPPVDVAIAGGGPVGSALALALSGSAISFARIADESEVAERPIALSHGSRLILERLGAWNPATSTPIQTIHVSQQGFGRTVMRCSDYGLPALGYVTRYSALLAHVAARSPAIGARLARWEHSGDELVLRLSMGGGEAFMRARLLVLADGGSSGRPDRVTDYRQSAVVGEVLTESAPPATAWERFTTEGPLALLPFRDRHALVWSVRPETASDLCRLSERAFLTRLSEAFGGRLGEFRSSARRASFPLSLRRGAVQPSPKVLAIGNAAQTLHPVAGQGLNLGLRDAWELAQMLLDSPKENIGAPGFLARYTRGRWFDRYAGIGFTDFLVRMFSNSVPPLAFARGAGLAMLDILPPARHFLARRMIFGSRALP